MRPILVFILIFVPSGISFSQDNSKPSNDFKHHIDKAQELNLMNLFSESISELKIAIDIAKKNINEEQLIDATISLGELMRRTQKPQEGLEILKEIPNSEKYPRLHVRKLGRMAAIYAENGKSFEKIDPNSNSKDSIKAYINEALQIAVLNNFELEEAGLRNELGLFIMRHENRSESMPHLMKSGSIYWKNKDTLGYIVTMVNVLENLREIEQLKSFDELSQRLVALAKGKQWFTAEARVFSQIAARYQLVGDSTNFYKWELRAAKNYGSYVKETSSQQMMSFQAIYETEKFQKKAIQSDLQNAQKDKELEYESTKSKNLIYSILALVFILGFVALIFVRERKLKNKLDQSNNELNISNEKYQLLMIESNHRIKNNLQMVISMLEYASDDVRETGAIALERISSKIHTISSLHKHLYSDVHNELVDLPVYFVEILDLYDIISSGRLSKKVNIESVRIKSERIVYFGLVLNELLANTIEHNSSDICEINIEVIPLDTAYQFTYCDDSKHDQSATSGTGSSLITQLIKRVGGKNLTIDKLTGTYQFTFHA